MVAAPLSFGVATAAPAAAASPDIVINEVYGGGGNSNATYNQDYVELYNAGDSAVDVSGMSVQYRSAGGTANPSGVVALTGSVPAGAYYLVGLATGTTGAPLPVTPDVTGTVNMSNSSGTVFLANQTGALVAPPTGSIVDDPAIRDLVGFGSSNTFETTAASTSGIDNTKSTSRSATDSDDNSADFEVAALSPGDATGTAPEPQEPTVATIAEIQGTEDAAALAGELVTTEGVVTGLYAGSLNGFVIQTGGTGGLPANDQTPGASDGIFVYGGSGFSGGGLALGDSVTVTGTASDYYGKTQISADSFEALAQPLAPVTPTVTEYPTTAEGREALESMLLAPTDELTVSNVYGINTYAEIGLATGSTPLIQPTEVADAQDSAAIEVVEADNAARGVILDDGASVNYSTGDDRNTPLPWLSPENPIRIGATATLTAPVVLDYGFSAWRFQPQTEVTDDGADVATFENTRAADAEPEDVGGGLTLGTFNVLNYFNTTGADFETAGGSCTYYEDRFGDPVSVDSCTPNGPRGAAELGDFRRQQRKIVEAINTMGADVVSLEEIENSVALGETDRDDALKQLVRALNNGAGSRRWEYVASPGEDALPDLDDQDVIRNAFIYDPSTVSPVGDSVVLVGSEAFANAREPLAQVFKPVGAGTDAAFTVISNHFKSKGSGADDGTGQGNANPDRVAQAEALSAFADDVAADTGVDATFLVGDFNSYTMEDPLQVLEGDRYVNISASTDEWSYSFSGLSGSLDHVLANEAAAALVTGSDIWEINADESVAFQYSRYNNNATRFYEPNVFAASDHNPILVGIDPTESSQVELNLLNINDFHGRINDDTTAFATTVERLRQEGGEDTTLFLSAGDNIGASVFASSIQQDEPTIDVLNALDLATSAVGNHEFDKGVDDLLGRVSDRADFGYLAANVYDADGEPILPSYATFEVAGLTVAVIGTVTEETPSLVSPGGIEGLTYGDPVEATNRVAGELTDGDEANGEADVIVAEYHEGAGAGTPDGATLEEEIAAGGAFADIVTETSAAVDAIFTGHTHKEYAWDGPVPGVEGATRPIVQTGSYGENLGQVELTLDLATGDVVSYEARNVGRVGSADTSFPRVAEVDGIVSEALDYAAAIGNQPVAEISEDITTAFSGGAYTEDGYAGGKRDDRASESTLGGLVADALLDGVSDLERSADLGITNPGGLRAELYYAGDTGDNPDNTDGTVTYAEANGVLPFSNTVVLVDLTGAQLVALLNEQWQTNPDGSIASRPYLQLGLSDNVRVVADPSKPAGQRITGLWIDDEFVDLGATYTVSTLSFLAQGGDNFRTFNDGTNYSDTGLLDAELWRDHLAANSTVDADFGRRQVFASRLPIALEAGSSPSFELGRAPGGSVPATGTALDLTSLGSPQNSTVTATLTVDGTELPLGEFAVTDGVAPVAFDLPESAAGGTVTMLVQPSGTVVTVPVVAAAEPDPGTPTKVDPVVKVDHKPARPRAGVDRVKVIVRVRADGQPAAGRVTIKVFGSKAYQRRLNDNGRTVVTLPPFGRAGKKGVRVVYQGNRTTRAEATKHFIRVVR